MNGAFKGVGSESIEEPARYYEPPLDGEFGEKDDVFTGSCEAYNMPKDQPVCIQVVENIGAVDLDIVLEVRDCCHSGSSDKEPTLGLLAFDETPDLKLCIHVLCGKRSGEEERCDVIGELVAQFVVER